MYFLESMLLMDQVPLTSYYQSLCLLICDCLEVVEQAQPLFKGKRCLRPMQIDTQGIANIFSLGARKKSAEGRPPC